MNTRIVVQLIELAEFADLLGLPHDSNEVVYRWVKQGHAAKFSAQYEQVAGKVEARCHDLCSGKGCRSPDRCPLRHELHQLMKDNGTW